jgi:hypothetical protein
VRNGSERNWIERNGKSTANGKMRGTKANQDKEEAKTTKPIFMIVERKRKEKIINWNRVTHKSRGIGALHFILMV